MRCIKYWNITFSAYDPSLTFAGQFKIYYAVEYIIDYIGMYAFYYIFFF